MDNIATLLNLLQSTALPTELPTVHTVKGGAVRAGHFLNATQDEYTHKTANFPTSDVSLSYAPEEKNQNKRQQFLKSQHQ